MEFTLMKRTSSSTVALPLLAHRKWNTLIPGIDLPHSETFSKILVANAAYLEQLLEKDRRELEELAKTTTEGDYELSFVEICQKLLEKEEYDHSTDAPKSKTTKEAGSETYHFYQTSDGQYFFLHPLDIKILKHEFGSYDSMPTHLKLPVISIRESTVNQVFYIHIGSSQTL
jgi:hypothetical protein